MLSHEHDPLNGAHGRSGQTGMNIAELSIRRPVTTIMFFVSLVVIGLIAAFRLPLEALPEVSPPFFFVQLPYTRVDARRKWSAT